MIKRRIARGLIIGLLLGGALPLRAQETGGQQTVPIYAATNVYERATQAFATGSYDQAVLDASLYILLNPTHNRGYFLRGLSYLQSDNPDSALADLNRTITLTGEGEPDFLAQAYTIRAAVYNEQDDTDAALADYAASIEITPTDNAYFARALLYREQGDNENALADLTEAINLAPEDALYPLYRGLVQNALGNTAEAAADVIRYIELVESSRVDADPLTPGTPIRVDLGFGTVQAFPIEGQTGQRLTALAIGEPADQTDPIIVLLDPDGTPLIADDDGTGTLGSLILDYVLPADGQYTLLVTSTPSQATGQIQIGIELLDP